MLTTSLPAFSSFFATSTVSLLSLPSVVFRGVSALGERFTTGEVAVEVCAELSTLS